MEHISKAQIKLIRSLQQKKYRDELGLFVAEGNKCVEELRNAFELEYLVIEGVNATRTEIEQLSGLRTPQGVIGVFRKRPMAEAGVHRSASEWPAAGLTVALDGIQDPGNLGTIIRTCDWFGVREIFCSSDTADCYNPKVVQATMGALARVRLTYTDLETLIRSVRVPIYGTLLDGRDMYEPGAIVSREHGLIIMGNEGNGISAPLRPYITHPLRIPSFPKNAVTSESLNVSIATAVILAEFRRG